MIRVTGEDVVAEAVGETGGVEAGVVGGFKDRAVGDIVRVGLGVATVGARDRERVGEVVGVGLGAAVAREERDSEAGGSGVGGGVIGAGIWVAVWAACS